MEERKFVALRVEGTAARNEREYFLHLLDEVEAADVKHEYAAIIQNIRERWTRHDSYGYPSRPRHQGDTKMVRKMAERLGIRHIQTLSMSWTAPQKANEKRRKR